MRYSEEQTSNYVDVGDLRIHYNEAGSGVPVVFVHGGGPGASGWSNFQQNLQVLAGDFRCILVDLPLFGKSDKPTSLSGSRMKYFADFLRDFLDALGTEQVNLVGNSIGGASCAKFAIEYPSRLNKLVIMGGGGTVTFDPARPETLGEGIVALVGFLADPTRAAAEKMLATFVHDFDKLPLDVVEARAELAVRPDIVAAQRTLFGDPSAIENLTDSLSRIEAKTLILWGREDKFIPLSGGMTYMQGIADCEMHVFANCGHWVMIEREQEFNRMVREFLAAEGSSS